MSEPSIEWPKFFPILKDGEFDHFAWAAPNIIYPTHQVCSISGLFETEDIKPEKKEMEI
jgi:hypothetical protein